MGLGSLGSLVALVLVANPLVLAANPLVPGRVVVTSTTVEFYSAIAFRLGSDRVPAAADRTIAAMAQTFADNPELLRIAVEGLVAPGEPESVGLRRAAAVRRRLIALGVAPARLVAEGAFGREPVIEFVVIRRAP